MQDEHVNLIYKILLALAGGVFGIAIAVTVQHIKLVGVPKVLACIAIVVQLLLSWGVFIFVIVLFKSALLPERIPNDDWSALTVAYFLSAIPHIVVATAILIYDKEINKWLKARYGDDVDLQATLKEKQTLGSEPTNEVGIENPSSKADEPEPFDEPKIHTCPSCNQEIKEETK